MGDVTKSDFPEDSRNESRNIHVHVQRPPRQRIAGGGALKLASSIESSCSSS